METSKKGLGFWKAIYSWTLDKIIIITVVGNIFLWILLTTRGQTVGGRVYNWKYSKKGFVFLLSWMTAGFVNWLLCVATLGIFWIISYGQWKHTRVWVHEKWFGYFKIFMVS